MSNVTEYLTNLQNLTKKNLEILKAINQAFYTKADHLVVDVNDEQYIIPSFLSLENKINTLEDNFENLVNAPKTGDAAFDFNGNTQTIEVKGYSNTPSPAFSNIEDDLYTDFSYEKNQIFKDFCTPKPYIKLDLSGLPTDIHQVNVKKIVPINNDLKSKIQSSLGEQGICRSKTYSDLVKELYTYEKDVDYTEYDTIYDLPIRGDLGVGTYNILEIEKNWTDKDLDEHYKLKLDNIKYFTKEETLQNNLTVGDYLVTSNDKVKLLIEEVKLSTNEITVKVMNGGYVDLTLYSANASLGQLKYLPSQDWSYYKYLNLPLEEDQYIYVFVAPIERISKIQSNWSTGLTFNIYNLKCDIDGVTYYYKDYYDKFVNNIGDSLSGITDMFDGSLINTTQSQFESLVNRVPVIDSNALVVTEINKHLNNSTTIEEIYGLYNQKKDIKIKLSQTQKEIDEIQNLLNSLTFSGTTQNRTLYEEQLKALNNSKKEYTQNINDLTSEISTAATDTDTPIDNPKYHIRGFFDYSSIDKELKDIKIHVIGIDVEYRYKNANKSTGTAQSVGENAIFSDWNKMSSMINKRRPKFEGASTGYSYSYENDTTNINEISFNQIDIPISQGETVDIRLRVIYNIGQPFIEVVSSWSDVVNIAFPDEYKQNVTVLDIISENNDDVEKQQYEVAMEKHGLIDHADDKIVDQNITYYHKPENISSGFYTDERRVIPLFDKLKELNDNINSLESEVFGNDSNSLSVVVSDNICDTTLTAFEQTTHIVPCYSTLDGKEGKAKTVVLNLAIKNISDRVIKLYSIFPGESNKAITSSSKSRYNASDYITNDLAVHFVDYKNGSSTDRTLRQVYNQVLYFRICSVYDGSRYYYNPEYESDTALLIGTSEVKNQPMKSGTATLFPSFTQNKQGVNSVVQQLCVPTTTTNAYMSIQPGESINVPLVFLFNVSSSNDSVTKTISFDIRTSLYQDPINYILSVTGKYSDSTGDKIRKRTTTKYNPVIVKSSTIK